MQPKFYWVFICLGLTLSVVRAQELFLFTYPASNVPKNALVLRGMNSFFNRTADNTVSYHFMPELEYGITKNWMIVTNGFLSNEDNRVNLEGGSFLLNIVFTLMICLKSTFGWPHGAESRLTQQKYIRKKLS